MAAQLTDRQRKRIIADYLELGSYNAVAKLHGVSRQTVKNVVTSETNAGQKLQQKKEQNTADIIAYMESQRAAVCDIINVGLEVLPEKIRNAKSASEVTTALGTLIDKWAAINAGPKDSTAEDALSQSLRELTEKLESDEVK